MLQALVYAVSASVAADFQTRWHAASHTGMASAALDANVAYPKHCSLAVVGAGWGGAYMAFRLAVDTNTVNATSVCVFEANGRVGGRIYSIHGLPHFADLAVDVGGYRFQQTQRLPADLVWSALELPTACYDWECAQQCEGTTCYVIKDAYGNNAGYATPIEAMLGHVEAAGAGRQVYFASELKKISPAPSVSPSATTLTFGNGQSVTADTVVLNMPSNAIENLDKSSLLFRQPATPKNVSKLLGEVNTFGMNKVYAWYDDAWWNTKLGLMEGYFTGHGGPNHTFAAPLNGRYHDGPQRCVIGEDTAGEPVYSGQKVQYGNCSGAIEVYYTRSAPYYEALMASPLQPLTVVTSDGTHTGGLSPEIASKFMKDVHEHLMSHHASAFAAKGVDPEKIESPKTVVLSNWIPEGKYTPGIGHIHPKGWTSSDAAKAAVRKPSETYDVFVVDQDYGYQSGWAVGSLAMAEKILQAELGLSKPTWLSAEWYKENVLAHL